MNKFRILTVLVLAMLLVSGTALATGESGSIVKVVGNIVVEEDQVVHGDVVAVVGNVEVRGQVYGNVVSVVGNTTVTSTGKVMGDAVAVVGNLNVASDDQVYGSKIGVIGRGGIDLSSIRIQPSFRSIFPLNIYFSTISLLTGILLSVIIVALFPLPVERVKKSIQGNPVRSGLIGLLGWILAGPAILLVAITIIGIPVAMLMGVGLWAARQLGYAALVLLLGQSILKGGSAPAIAAFGALLLGITAFVPGLGWLVGLLVSLLALGAALETRFGTREAA